MKKLFLLFLALPLLFIACSDDDKGDINENLSISIFSDESYDLKSGNIEGIEGLDTFIAKISNNGIIIANHAGNTKAVVKFKDKTINCDIEIKPRTTLYNDMAIYLGAKESVITDIFGTHTSQNKETRFYKSIGKEQQNLFVVRDGEIVYSGIDFATSYATEVGKHLADRYALISTNNGKILYSNSLDESDNNRILVTVENNLKTIRIVYTLQSSIMTKGAFCSDL